MRQIVLDTETTGLEVSQGHRIIEIGCIELRNRRTTGNDYWHYLNPNRAIDAGAEAVHGISGAFLADKPPFGEIADGLWDYLAGAELIIHNAAFDLGFLDAEFARVGKTQKLTEVCSVIDTVAMARRLHPGQKANLDALCRRYSIDNSHRDLHGAKLDARLLADVYLAMTGGQSALLLDAGQGAAGTQASRSRFAELLGSPIAPPVVIRADAAELAAHAARLQTIVKKSSGKLIWTDDLPAAT